MPTPRRAWEIVKEVGHIVASAAVKAGGDFADREGVVQVASDSTETLINEYFDILPLEKTLIDDTVRVIIPSVRPTRRRPVVPTIDPSKEQQ
jgi:hypothetical protein